MNYIAPDGIGGMIFDLDGTLANTMPFHMQAWKSACKHYGLDMSSEFLRSNTGKPGTTIVKAFLKHIGMDGILNPSEISDYKMTQFRIMQSKVTEVKPVADIVRKYHGILPLAVGTGGKKETVLKTLDIIGMKKYFEYIVTADDVMEHKPNPETFLKCSELMQINPSKIVVFEDGDLGIEAAHKAGMTAVDVRGWYDYSW